MSIRNFPQAIFWRGREWVVSPHFFATCLEPHPDLETAEPEELMGEIWGLLNQSEARALTDEERDRLQAVVKHWNLRSNIDFLQGRAISDFGFDFYDQCHGQRGTFDCGCQLHYVFDHYKALAIADGLESVKAKVLTNDAPLDCFPHYPRHVCKDHRHLSADLSQLHAEVAARAA